MECPFAEARRLRRLLTTPATNDATALAQLDAIETLVRELYRDPSAWLAAIASIRGRLLVS